MFVQLSGKIWQIAVKPRNIISGYGNTEIFLLEKTHMSELTTENKHLDILYMNDLSITCLNMPNSRDTFVSSTQKSVRFIYRKMVNICKCSNRTNSRKTPSKKIPT